jgi:hypothetical protein
MEVLDGPGEIQGFCLHKAICDLNYELAMTLSTRDV